MLAADANRVGARCDADGGVVLLRAVNVIQEIVVGGYVIELRRRLVDCVVQVLPPSTEMVAPPSLPLIMRFGLFGIDPETVMISVWRG